MQLGRWVPSAWCTLLWSLSPVSLSYAPDIRQDSHTAVLSLLFFREEVSRCILVAVSCAISECFSPVPWKMREWQKKWYTKQEAADKLAHKFILSEDILALHLTFTWKASLAQWQIILICNFLCFISGTLCIAYINAQTRVTTLQSCGDKKRTKNPCLKPVVHLLFCADVPPPSETQFSAQTRIMRNSCKCSPFPV